MPGGRVAVEAPPEPPEPAPAHPLARLMPVAMVAAVAGMSALYLTSGAAPRSPMFLFFPVMMLVSTLGTLAYGGRGARGGAVLNVQRATYLRYLGSVEDGLTESAVAQHVYLHWHHPDPAALWTLVDGERRWERAADHPEFCAVSVGVGERPAATVVVAPEVATAENADPVTTGALERLMRVRSTVHEVPVVVALADTRVVTVGGDPESARALVRAMVCQLAVLHHPDLVGIAAAPAPGEWDWLKWLPHQGRSGTARHRVLIVDGSEVPQSGPGLTLIDIRAEAPGAEVTVSADDEVLTVACDRLSLPDAVACARRVARHRPDPAARARTGAVDWPALMGIDDPQTVDADTLWAGKTRALLRVPIGSAPDGSVVSLDIKEAAAGGMGPHGLCVGATGSGKSEFLRTLTLGMIASHSPEVLNLVLVDFKGGATFLGLEQARHVSAVITNLADEAQLVARMRDALSGEVTRRQELLRAAGNVTNIGQYAHARRQNPALAPLPVLFVVVDEFSELLSQHPDFAELFVAIGRLGRSLGMHLLLASQRLDEGRLRGLETHLSYRICLKTFSAGDSRAVLGVADAYHLPAEPGAGFLRTASGELTRFQTAFVSGGYTPRVTPAPEAVAVRLFDHAGQAPAADTPPQRPLLDTVLRRLAARGPAAHRVWLPPLERSPSLDALLAARTLPGLRVPVGVVDCPFDQRYDPLDIDLTGAAGNVAVVGGPRSGKSSTLRTIVCALAATRDPSAAQFYCLDFGGGVLAGVAGLPHVGSVAGRRDTELCRRTVAQVESILRSRERAPGDRHGDVFLVIDGWATVRADFESLEPAITALAAHGLSYGIHVMIAASRWADLRPALKDQIGTRIELRLGDPAESEMDRRRAHDLADRPPGRGLTRAGRELAIAVPASDCVDAIRRRTAGPAAPPVELLPARVNLRTVTASAMSPPARVVLGLGERDLRPIGLDVVEHPHLLILGEGECGKTSVLRALCTELVRTRGPEQVSIEIVDYRRTMLGVVESAHLSGYSVSGTALTSRLSALRDLLDARMPDENVTQQQLRDRCWWTGPDLVVVVDDYDLVAGATGNPLTPLADYLPHAKDLGLHVVVARRSGGAARAMFDPVLTRLRDMGCAGLMMSASPDEGVLLGTARSGPLPPGRGTLVVRGAPDELVQVGWVDPP
ncbi:type VII secretion protein EccCa/type VII secretion protein EccCb [Mycolicibacterium chubuense NBB4]|uniref:Type VII secretion protein EccCa/type VII secretion protein EccCb n=2 Tax=Mycolicibacterium chubuense TaxID=1800 RepID=I4BF05_MYCCN|nr:type VII secretion protein EccCa/type VII secretion protein EccCb [Mycolicibacterium chubuense NBB4]